MFLALQTAAELTFNRNPAIDVAADCLAAPRRNLEADSAAPWQRAPPLDHVQVAAVRAAWHESLPPLRAPRGGDMPSLDPLHTRCRAWLDRLETNYSKTSRIRLRGFVSMCACTQPVRAGIGAVCVEYGRPKWPITMSNHTSLNHARVQNIVLIFIFGTLCSYDPLWRGFFA